MAILVRIRPAIVFPLGIIMKNVVNFVANEGHNHASGELDHANFIDSAKHCFARMQHAWNEGDLADIRRFTTDQVFNEIQDQHRANGGQSCTEILSLDAELLSANDLGSRKEAIVLFRAELKEDNTQQPVEEVWHFVKPSYHNQPTWLLDGIQQVEG
jgi:predicted lipid-binding transport protein (Tim44 family)